VLKKRIPFLILRLQARILVTILTELHRIYFRRSSALKCGASSMSSRKARYGIMKLVLFARAEEIFNRDGSPF
jgi:hypothetical protein